MALCIESSAWLCVDLLDLGIRAIVSLTGGPAVYLWWIWVVGPWGLVVAARLVEGRHRRARRMTASTRF